MSNLNKSDESKMVKMANDLFGGFNDYDRVYVDKAPESVLSFYEGNKDLINASVFVIRGIDDEMKAMRVKHSEEKALLVFSGEYLKSTSLTAISCKMVLPKALLKRAS